MEHPDENQDAPESTDFVGASWGIWAALILGYLLAAYIWG